MWYGLAVNRLRQGREAVRYADSPRFCLKLVDFSLSRCGTVRRWTACDRGQAVKLADFPRFCLKFLTFPCLDVVRFGGEPPVTGDRGEAVRLADSFNNTFNKFKEDTGISYKNRMKRKKKSRQKSATTKISEKNIFWPGNVLYVYFRISYQVQKPLKNRKYQNV